MLLPIGDKPLICHVVERAKKSNIKDIFVGTDSVEIMAALKNEGVECIMTSKEHISGSDRVYEAITRVDPKGKINSVINLQGDMPFINPAILNDIAKYAAQSKADILTPIAFIDPRNTAKISNPNVVKAAVSFYDDTRTLGKALYFSRQPIPYGASSYCEHIGVYLYKRDALGKFVNSPQNNLEQCERLEQLRALALGMTIDVFTTTASPISVDTQEDLDAVRLEYEANLQKLCS
jgi:3-deoxy-manno-octulosonate cytidylyltransferase (CMP-KDO synthetase)